MNHPLSKNSMLVALFLTHLMSLASLARPWLYPPDYSPEFRTFMLETANLGSRGYELAARDRFLEYARSHEGTEAGGSALLSAANLTYSRLGDQAAGRALFAEACQKYPGSMIEVGARSNQATWDRNATGDSAAYIAAMSQISTDLGGPSVQQVLAAGADTSVLAAQLRRLHPETQLGIWHAFKNVYYEYKLTNFEQALAIARFGRSALEPAALPEDEAYSNFLVELLDERYNVVGNFTSTPSTPQTTIVTPLQGATVAPNPTLRLRVTSGDYHHTTVDLTRLVFKVDDVDRSFEVVVKSDLNLSFAEGVDFETLTLSLPTTLEPGTHTASVFVVRSKIAGDPPSGPEGQTTSWSFTVSDNPPPSPNPTTQTLPVSKDAILSQQHPHRNEGGNELLQLSRRPEESGKSNNPLVAFDLSDTNRTGLTKARLVLSVQQCEQPKRWGAEGRNILAYPVMQAWVEGNGQTLRTGQNEKTRGEGQGATWFSPVDENIANKVPNGALQWGGARSFLGPLTAPPVLVVNKQTGIVEFDVTLDVKSGAVNGWLLRKQDESAFGNVRFYSKEGAADLAPRLILEYGGSTAAKDSAWDRLLALFGFGQAQAGGQVISTLTGWPKYLTLASNEVL